MSLGTLGDRALPLSALAAAAYAVATAFPVVECTGPRTRDTAFQPAPWPAYICR